MRVSFAILAVVFLVSVACAGDEPAALRARQLAREAMAAAEADDTATRLAKLAGAVQLMPEHPRYLLELAAAQTASGEPGLAVQTLERVAAMGNHGELAAIEPFAPLRERADFRAVCSMMARLLQPVGRGDVAFVIQESRGLIEGIAFRPRTNETFFGDVHQRAIWKRASDGLISRFDAGDEHVPGVFGLEVDEARGALWAATSAVPEMKGYTPEMKGRAGVVEFDLETGAVRRMVFVPADSKGHVIGDLLVARDGAVFATDSVAPVIWRLVPGGDGLEPWLEDPEFLSLQGLAFSGDETALFVAAYGNGLLRVDLATRTVTRMQTPAGATLLGIDGLERARDGSLIAVQNGIAPARVVRLEFEAAERALRSVTVLEAAQPTMVDPTLLCSTADGMLVVGDAGWRFFERGGGSEARTRAVPVFRVQVLSP